MKYSINDKNNITSTITLRINPYLYSLLISLGLLLMAIPVFGQESMPEGSGRDVMFVSCTQCHGLNYFTNVSLTAAQWENALYDMIARGAIVEKDDLGVLRDYLIDNYATDR
jgi:hypothetical protein